jgi:hypothetical protein
VVMFRCIDGCIICTRRRYWYANYYPVRFTLVSISISTSISLYQMRNGLVCRKLHQVVLSRRVAAQCFHALYVEKLGVLYGGRMVPWLCFVASTAVLFVRDVGIRMLTIIPFGLHWFLYLFLYLYLYIK